MVDQGKQVLGEGTLNWMVVKGKDKDAKDKTVLVASFPSIIAGKSFLVIGQALKTDTGNLSYNAKRGGKYYRPTSFRAHPAGQQQKC